MPMHGGHLWRSHPGVRTGDQLSAGERAADHLKRGFGSWPFLIILNVFIGAWMLWNVLTSAKFDPYPWLALNIILSWLAAQQGGALQIAANRGDRISAEVAAHTQANTDALMVGKRPAVGDPDADGWPGREDRGPRRGGTAGDGRAGGA